jgi:hypothetical protein
MANQDYTKWKEIMELIIPPPFVRDFVFLKGTRITTSIKPLTQTPDLGTYEIISYIQ